MLRVGSVSATATEIHPVWKDDLSIEYELESQQWFHRAKLSGSIDLIRGDYDLVMAETFGTVFYLEILIGDGGTPYTDWWRGKFTLTDCKVNKDDKKLTVKPDVVDQYTDILAGLEKEFDLIRLTPVINRIQMSRRPCLQIFDTKAEKVMCVCGNVSWEQDANRELYLFITDHCHFQALERVVELDFTDTAWQYEQYFQTPYTGEIYQDGDRLTNDSNTFYIEYFQYNALPIYINGFYIKNYAQNEVFWKFEQTNQGYYADLPAEIEFVSQRPDSYGNMKADCLEHGLYSRVVCNVEQYIGAATFEIPNDDIVGYNRNYRRCFPYDAQSHIVTSTRASIDPTKYGRRESDGLYYLPPDSTYQYVPIGQSLWGTQSVWFLLDNSYRQLDNDATYGYWLNDAFPLWSVLDVLLKEVAPNITFAGTSTYSNFLYSGFDPVQGRDNRLYITPKSNVTNGEYHTPAQKAPITLRDVLNMLRDTYRCYWFIDSSNRLRIEHVRYFMNGGRYSGLTPTVSIDLTVLTNPRNEKTWDFGTNVYEFEKMEMPERFEFAWMDEVTEIFKGYPMNMLSPYVELGKIEEINVSHFTSDIDYMQLNPSAISPDGFALLNVNGTTGNLYVPTLTFSYGGFTRTCQNGWLSFFQLEVAYWLDNLPCRNVEIDGDPNYQAVSISRNKKQTVQIPLTMTDPDMQALVKTGLGYGQVQQMTIRLTSRMAKTQLRYGNE